MRKGSLLLVCFGSLAISAWGVKAKPGIIEYKPSNGETLSILLHGDERFHYATTPDDKIIMLNQEGNYEYAVIDAGGILKLSGLEVSKNIPDDIHFSFVKGADYKITLKPNSIRTRYSKQNETRTGSPKYRYSTSAFPTTGDPHSLVILVEYQDVGFKLQDPLKYYKDFLNGENFTQNKGTGSCRQYFIDNSSGAFQPTFDVFGPVLLKYNRGYYGGGNELNACKMVVEAVEALDSQVDFSQYDHNGDGYVDSVYIIYAGKGENDGGPPESVWPYSFELLEENVYLKADGVVFNTYGVSNEEQGDGDIDGIGTFTHEFGHVLGLPDLYNTASYDTTTPDEWSVMDSGSYNNDSRTPPNYSAFERYSLGWLSPEEILSSGDYSLQNIASDNSAFIMTTEEKPDEFYMLEYRTLSGWDRFLPNHGMLVWHIDFVQEKWDLNTVNNSKSHQHVELVRADNSKTNTSYSFMGDSFPGSNNVTVFANNTAPALKSWLGYDLNVTSISEIEEKDESVKFKAKVKEERSPAGIFIIGDEESDNIKVDGQSIYSDCGIHSVYDISGRTVGTVSSSCPLTLPRGLYIVSGKKILIR